jgi:hypothetical protein
MALGIGLERTQKRAILMFLVLDTTTQIYLFFAIAILSFFIANSMDGVLGPDGFGIIGNQLIVIAGFYLGLIVAKYYRFPLSDLANMAVAGLSGAFVALLVLSVSKAILARL